MGPERGEVRRTPRLDLMGVESQMLTPLTAIAWAETPLRTIVQPEGAAEAWKWEMPLAPEVGPTKTMTIRITAEARRVAKDTNMKKIRGMDVVMGLVERTTVKGLQAEPSRDHQLNSSDNRID
mmetsp:Transcript_6172/g.10750  ORF Transcript_6172/g.10750 Transcript_6172/m.10750 type:complete len:123 (-) Transcript_6172:1008-1376(-)